jgi:SAM-dependent methyltransferase
MKRKFLFAWYQTPRGKLLKELETDYLKKAITVSCQQHILQIGGLGWESEFIDCSLYKNYTILDAKGLGCEMARKIRAKAYSLPIQTDSMDMVIVPHLLEFDTHRFQTMREIERILKPEGILVILNFNPLSFWVRYQFLWDKKLADSWGGHFIFRSRMFDWLKLLNFEVTVSSIFNLDTVLSKQGKSINDGFSFFYTAYAVKAIKRRYNIIPLTPIKNLNNRYSLVNSLNSVAQRKKYE